MIKYYKNRKHLQELKIEARKLKLSTVSINFVDIQGKKTDGQSGKIVFGVRSPPIETKLTINQLNQKLKDRKIDYIELLDLLELQALKLNSSRWDNFKSLFTG